MNAKYGYIYSGNYVNQKKYGITKIGMTQDSPSARRSNIERTSGHAFRMRRYIRIEGITKEDFESKWLHYFDLNRDYAALKAGLCENDEVMSEAVKFAPGIRILNQDFFECLISFIISQNNRIPMIKKVIANKKKV